MSDPAFTHAGFSDESNWNKGRFRSLAVVTTTIAQLGRWEDKLRHVLGESEIREFEWKKLNSARERFAAEKICSLAVEAAREGVFRVDVLVWDTEDSRHKFRGRDDVGNLQRMYFHLFRNVLRARWPPNAVWRLHPDEHTAMDWKTVMDCLENVAETPNVERSLFTRGGFRVRLRREFAIEDIQPGVSGQQPLLQLGDLFAGMGQFSRDKFEEYRVWLEANTGQCLLFGGQGDGAALSRSSRERFEVLRSFDELCKRHKLGVSLRSYRGLRTPNPENPLNFWMYEPQRLDDKAPTKGRI